MEGVSRGKKGGAGGALVGWVGLEEWEVCMYVWRYVCMEVCM